MFSTVSSRTRLAVTLNNNIASFRAQRRLAKATHALSKSFTRLSSGLRINSAADDASGLSVGSLLKTDARVYSQAIRNVNDAISMFDIAAGAAGELGTLMTRVKELSLQASNGVLSSAQRMALDREAQALISEYTRILNTTSFNGMQLLSATSNQVDIQLGYSTDMVTYSLGKAINYSEPYLTGTGTFAAGVSYAPSTNAGPNGIELADVNGDGRLDAIVASHSGTNKGIDVLLNTGSGFGPATMNFLGHDIYDIKLADFNGDGKIDIAASDFGSGYIDILLGAGNGSFSLAVSYATTSTGPLFLDVADLNGDGIQDIAVNTLTGNRVNVLFGAGNGTFSAPVSYAGGGWNMVLADINNDGNIDMLTPTGGGLNRFLNNGSGGFGSATAYGSGLYRGVAVGDFNNDGWKDVAVGVNGSSNLFRVLLNNQAGGFTVGGTFAGANDQTSLAADFNGDGNLDIVFAGRTIGATIVVLGNSDGTFKSPTTLGLGTFQDVAVGDVTGDGVADIVSTTYGGRTFVFASHTALSPGVPTASLLSGINLRTRDAALASINAATQVSKNVTREIANIGAAQSRLSSAAASLSIRIENLESAASQIFDVDVASETSELTRGRILQQSAAGVLAQANLSPSLALKLLEF